MSSLPSPFTSPKVTDAGLVPVPVPYGTWVLKEPLPLPNSTLTLLEVPFAVMMSSLPSPFTSPKVTERGASPVARGGREVIKVPLPLPKSTLALSEL